MSVFQQIYKENQSFLKEVLEIQTTTIDTYFHTVYENIAVNTFEWTGIDEMYRKSWIEHLLYYYPQLATFEDHGKKLILPASASGKILENGLYSRYTMYAPNGDTYIRDLEDIELLFNNSLVVSTFSIQKPIINGLILTFNGIMENIQRAKMGGVLSAKDETTINLILQQFKESITEIKPLKIVQREGISEDIAWTPIFDNSVTDLNSLWESLSKFKSMALNDIGFGTIDIFKNERLTEAESKANINTTKYSLGDDMLTHREDFCERVKRHFGWDYGVIMKRDYDLYTNEEGGENNERSEEIGNN